MSTSLPLPTDQELPEDVLRRLRDRPPISIYRLIATAPQLLIPWTDLVSALYQSTVPARLREIAILRQAACANSLYELHQQGILALSNGPSEEEIALIISSQPVTTLSAAENLVCRMSEQLERNPRWMKRPSRRPDRFLMIVSLSNLWWSSAFTFVSLAFLMQAASKLKAVIHSKPVPHRVNSQILKVYKLRHSTKSSALVRHRLLSLCSLTG